MQITVGKSDQRYDLPAEVCGWMMRKFGLKENDWVLLCTADHHTTLACNLVIRGPVVVNLVVGISDMTSSKVYLLLLFAQVLCALSDCCYL